ncbi:MAG: hypothetical protein J7485_02215 [Sphingobium sp.]|nr:hypothetical protein [Sphingobium sp.]
MAIAAFVVVCAGTANAAPAPKTRLVSCGSESCLLVTGRRKGADSLVSINNRLVAVEGRRAWHVRVPLAAVRELTSPYARSIEVTVAQANGHEEWSEDASLPIGLLGHKNLATLVVSAR